MVKLSEVKQRTGNADGGVPGLPLDDPEVEPVAQQVQRFDTSRFGSEIEVSRASLADQADVFNGLFYGDGGTGKTTDLAAMAHQGKILMINAEVGIKARALRQRGIPLENITVVPDPNSGQEISYDLLESLFWELKSDLATGNSEYVGTAWDSLTEIAKKITTQNIRRRVRRSLSTGRGNTDPFLTDISDFGYMTEQLRGLVRSYRDLPIHFGASALERRDTDDDGKVIYRPALTPALSGDVYGYVDFVIHTEVYEDPAGGDDDIYLGLTRPVGKYKAKDRLGLLPKRLADPTWDRVFSYLVEELDDETDPVQTETRSRLLSGASPVGDDEPDDQS